MISIIKFKNYNGKVKTENCNPQILSMKQQKI